MTLAPKRRPIARYLLAAALAIVFGAIILLAQSLSLSDKVGILQVKVRALEHRIDLLDAELQQMRNASTAAPVATDCAICNACPCECWRGGH